jgi:hypothetical protein
MVVSRKLASCLRASIFSALGFFRATSTSSLSLLMLKKAKFEPEKSAD